MISKDKTAVFIGHRDCFNLTSEDIIPKIEEAIGMGIVSFLNGGQGYFDKLCAYAVHSLKEKYPYIKLHLIAPYTSLKVDNKDLYDEMALFAPEWYIQQIGFKKAIPQRNEWMIDNSSVAICYVVHRSTGSWKTMAKAILNQLKIIDVDSCNNPDN